MLESINQSNKRSVCQVSEKLKKIIVYEMEYNPLEVKKSSNDFTSVLYNEKQI